MTQRISGLAQKQFLGERGGVRLSLVTDPAGLVESPPCDCVRVCIHAGPPVYAHCSHGTAQHRGTVIFGDVDIIPPHTPATWELKATDVDLVIMIDTDLLHRIEQDAGHDPCRLEVRSRFQARDARIEHIGWALKAEMESGYPSGTVFVDSLAEGLAACLVYNHTSAAREPVGMTGALAARRLRDATAFIEANLSRPLSLNEIAQVSGLGVSQFKVQFRRSVGQSVHQYVIRRRVDRAAGLLRDGRLSINQVAMEVGFCHQSHLAKHMRRLLGRVPSELGHAS